MIYDSGVCSIYAVDSTEGSAPPPVRITLRRKWTQPCGEKIVGASRYYKAAKVGQRIDRRIQMWRREDVSVRDVCEYNGVFYRIRKVTSATDEDGLLVTELDLEEDDNTIRGWQRESNTG